MASVHMSKIKILGLKSERTLILNELEKTGCFEVIPTSAVGAGEKIRDTSALDACLSRRAKVSFAINFLESVNTEALDIINSDIKKQKKKKYKNLSVRDFGSKPQKKKNGRAIIGYDDLYDAAAKEYELLTVCDELEKMSFKRVELKSATQKLANINKNLKAYENLDIKFSDFKETKTSVSILALGSLSAPNPLEGIDAYIERYPSVSGTLLAIVAQKELKQQITEKLIISGFSICPFTESDTAKNIIAKNSAQIESDIIQDEECIERTLSYTKYLSELKTLYDVFSLEIEKADFELEFVKTNSTFLLEGWTVKDRSDKIISALKEKTQKIITEVSDPKEGDDPPTLLKNKAVFSVFEDTTNMYSAPSYGETDPNPFMAVFFFVFFGIMLGDAGYGLVLSIGCFIILKLFKLETGMKNMIAVFGICGISAVIWGILLGGVFAIDGIPAIWFSPFEDPIMMLILSIVLGIIQIAVGYGINSYKKIKSGKIADGILDTVFVYIIFIAVACLALGMVIETGSLLGDIGLYLLIAALIGILLTNGRHSKGVGGKVAGGLVGIYNLINLFSDVLSYARIFGLALASGAIGLAFNQLGAMIFQIPVIGYVIGGALLIVLHAFNMGLSLLSTYVHNIRLQYLEFYSKFYEGGGRIFSPMGQKTKYVRFK